MTSTKLGTDTLLPLFLGYANLLGAEKTLLKVHNDILINMNSQHVTLLVSLYLSSAFDNVDQKVLLEEMKATIGIRGSALYWFVSYLTNRQQCLTIEQNLSKSSTWVVA